MNTNAQPDREKEIFEQAVEITSLAEREAFLNIACAGQPALRARVDALLRAHDEVSQFLGDKSEMPAAPGTIELSAPPEEQPGERIGRYKLLQKIGEGGCGAVYMAEQEEPVRRRVALKVIKLGMDTKQVVARFEAERQALALMDHQNIAKVLDAGATEAGRPFFVMELVKGVPVTRYANENKLDIQQRLDLFIQICQAVQHAHQKGIIHRDIKPSNVLVADHDGTPVPKVIDFGIAKATTDQRLTDKTLFTALEQFIGTPAYMSPEQAKLSGLDVDTRSDIYSLGVLLYELLTGKTPFDARRLLDAGFDEIRRIIREEDPPRPSTRLSTLDVVEQTDVAKHRHSELPKLLGVIRGDLDWIVMKCLEKDRTRRYETANGLAADLQRHLNNEPVVARPPSTVYRFQKLVRRNKVAFAGAMAVLTTLVIGLSVSTWLYFRESNARQRASLAEVEQASERQRAERAAERATNESIVSKQAFHLAEGQLYQSLVREARATRLARQVGYREKVFRLLKQAVELPVAAKDRTQLRREASLCFGDYVGLTPTVLTNFSNDGIGVRSRVDPTGRYTAIALDGGAIVMRRLPSGEEAGRYDGRLTSPAMSFNATGDRFVSIEESQATIFTQKLARARICLWKPDINGRWSVEKKVAIPGAIQCFSTPAHVLIATVDNDFGVLNLLDAETTNAVVRIVMPEGKVMSRASGSFLNASADGRYLAIRTRLRNGTREPSLDLWKLEPGKDPKRLEELSLPVGDSFALSGDGSYLGILTDSSATIYSTDNGAQVTRVQEWFQFTSQLTFAPQGTVIALPILQQGKVRLWDWVRNETVVLGVPKLTEKVVFSASGFLLAANQKEGRLYQVNTPSERVALLGHEGGVSGAVFSPNGSRVATLGKDRTVRVWDARSGRPVWKSSTQDYAGEAVAYSPDGRYIVTTTMGEGGLFRVWDAESGERLLKVGTNSSDTGWSIQFSKDGGYLATATEGSGDSGTVDVWRFTASDDPKGLPDVTPLASLSTPALQHVEIAPDGQWLIFTGRNGEAKRWSFLTATNAIPALKNLLVSNQPLSVTPDGQRLLVMNKNRSISVFDSTNRTKLSTFELPSFEQAESRGDSWRLCLSPDGRKIAIESFSRSGVDLVDAKSGQFLFSLPEQNGTVWWLAWSPDGKRLVVSRSNGDVSIWNLDEMERMLTSIGLAQ